MRASSINVERPAACKCYRSSVAQVRVALIISGPTLAGGRAIICNRWWLAPHETVLVGIRRVDKALCANVRDLGRQRKLL